VRGGEIGPPSIEWVQQHFRISLFAVTKCLGLFIKKASGRDQWARQRRKNRGKADLDIKDMVCQEKRGTVGVTNFSKRGLVLRHTQKLYVQGGKHKRR